VAKFRFRLEKVLTLREEELNVREGELRDAQMKVNKIEAYIQDTINTSNRQHVQVGSVMMAEEYFLRGTCLERLRKELEQARVLLTEAHTELSAARERYVEAKKEVKVLEKLKEKKLEQYNEEEAKKEQNFLDEIAVMRRTKSVYE
jgi:flagellar FliJ protein